MIRLYQDQIDEPDNYRLAHEFFNYDLTVYTEQIVDNQLYTLTNDRDDYFDHHHQITTIIYFA